MKQSASVSWRTTGVAVCACLLASSLVVLLTRHNTVKPNRLASSSATQWLVHRPSERVVLVDGFSGEVLASIRAESDASDAVAVQGPGGAFLVSNSTRTARSISSRKLQLGTSRALGALASDQAQVGVGAAGLTAVDSRNGLVDVLSVDAAARSIDIPQSAESLIAGDGSVWLLRSGSATHVPLDGEATETFDLPGERDALTSVGEQPLTLDRSQRLVHWVTGGDISIRDLPSAGSAVLQEPGGPAPCAWVGSADQIACVGPTTIDRRVTVPGLQLDKQARFGVIGSIVVVVRADNSFERFDLTTGERLGQPTTAPATTSRLDITVANEMVWIDDVEGDIAWVVQRFGQRQINKDDPTAPLFDADGTTIAGGGGEGDLEAPGGTSGDGGQQLDDNQVDDPPIAVDDEVTAGADKQSVSIPVTDNDFDPDGDAIAVLAVEPGGYGETFVLNATTVVYRPTRPGLDTFSYTITDQNGNEAIAEVRVEIFEPNRENEVPTTLDDEAATRVGVAVEVDVLANDVDPERDDLDLDVREQPADGTVDKITLGSGRLALRYTPGPDSAGTDRFTYVAIDSTGARSRETTVEVVVSSRASANRPPTAAPDAARVRTDQPTTIAVLQNDVDPDNDPLTLILPRTRPPGLSLRRDGDQLIITPRAGLPTRSIVTYTVQDSGGLTDTGTVLILVDDPSVPNRPPVANPDPMSIVEGTSIEIDVLKNDTDPDSDPIVLRSVAQSTSADWRVDALDGGKVLFSSTATGLTEPTQAIFSYEIADPYGLLASGTVTVAISPKDASSVMVAGDDPVVVRRGQSQAKDVLVNDTTTAEPAQLFGTPSCRATGVTAIKTSNEFINITASPTAPLGETTCTYQVVDHLGSKDIGTINVTVEDVLTENTPPRVSNNSIIPATVGDPVVTIDLLARVTDDDDDELTFSRTQSNTKGTFVLDGSTVRYTLPLTGPAVDLQQFTVSDGVNQPVPFSVAIDVRNKANAAPIAVDLSAVTPDRSVRLSWRSRAADPGGDTSTLTATVTRGNGARVDIDGGFFVVTADQNFFGDFETQYTVTDVDGLTSSPATIKVTFPRPVNVSPTAAPDRLQVDAGGSGSINVLNNDTDTEANLTTRLLQPADLSRGTPTLEPDGTFRFVTKPAELGGTVVYQYEVTDSEGARDETSITVTVLPCAETAPVITAPPIVVGLFERPLISLDSYVSNGTVDPSSVSGGGLTGPSGTLDVPAGFEGDVTIQFSAVNACKLRTAGSLRVQVNRAPVAQPIQRSMGRGASLSIPAGQIGSDDEPIRIVSLESAPSWATLATGGSALNLSPPNSQISGQFTFSAQIGDPGSGRVTVLVTINVTNQPPVAAPDLFTTAPDHVVIDPRTNDSDPEGGGLRIVSASLRSGGARIKVSDDNLTITDLVHGFSEITYTIVDDEGASATSTIRILQNNTPETSDQSFVMYDSVLEFDLPAQDADGDPLSVIADGPAGFTTTVSQVNGVIRMRLEANEPFEPGTSIYFYYSVVDPFGAASESVIYLELDFDLSVGVS